MFYLYKLKSIVYLTDTGYSVDMGQLLTYIFNLNHYISNNKITKTKFKH